MVLSTQSQGDDSMLNARMDNARNISIMLKAIHFKDTATVCATENGLKVTVEDSKCIQANAFIQDQSFQEYSIKDDSMTFRINLDILLECLNMFGTSPPSITALMMSYNGYGTPLVLTLEEDGVVVDCSVATQEPDEILDFEFSAANVVNKVIMKAECLRDAFNELDTTSEVLEITMSPDEPYFRLSTYGTLGQAHALTLNIQTTYLTRRYPDLRQEPPQHDIPDDSDMMEYFECGQTDVNRYRLNLLKPAVKAVSLACKVCIRVDHRGFLSLQFMIKNETGTTCFVEYYCCPDEAVASPS